MSETKKLEMVTPWARAHGFSPSTARKWAGILNLGEKPEGRNTPRLLDYKAKCILLKKMMGLVKKPRKK